MSGSVASASRPIVTSTMAEEPDRVGDRVDAPAQPIAPAGEPQDEGESINSKECVEDPRTSESMRIQPISKTNEAAPVRRATARKNLKGAAPPDPPRSGASPHRLLGAAGEQPHGGGESEIQGPAL